MSDITYPLIAIIEREATSTSTFTAKTKKLKPGDVMELCAVAARNLNSTNEVIDIGVIRGSSVFYMKTITLAVAGTWYFTRFHIKIPSEYQIIFRIITPTDGDLFTFNIFGFLNPGHAGHT